MSRGARKTLVVVAVGAAVGLSGGLRVTAARAADGQQASVLAAAIDDYANAQVDAAMTEANAVVAQATQVEVALPAAPNEPVVSEPRSASVGQPASVAVGPVEIPAIATGQAGSPQTVLPVMPSGTLGLSGAGRPTRHHVARVAHRLRTTVRVRKTVSRGATILRLDVRESSSAGWSSSSSSARSVARSSVHSSVQSSTSGRGRSPRPAPSKVPLPFPPLPPNAPAPNSGATQTGGSGGQGALLIFFVALAALVLFGIHRLLRKVHWSNLRMPRRGAVLPWRPG